MKLSGLGVWSVPLGFGDPAEIADAAAELEELGYSALWIGDSDGRVFEGVGRLLAATDHMVVGTGILNLWMHTPAEAAATYASLCEAHGDRLLMGIGVSHGQLVDASEPGRYRKPMTAMSNFLDGLDTAKPPVSAQRRVLAALGPKMLELAAKRSSGVHPYLVTPEHTRRAREVVGDGALVLPEQAVILCSGRDEARAIGAEWLGFYCGLPNYARSLLRMGFTGDDIEQVSDRLFDALIAWGDEDTIKRRVDEHFAAGADHVCVQVLKADPMVFPRAEWRRLAALA